MLLLIASMLPFVGVWPPAERFFRASLHMKNKLCSHGDKEDGKHE